MFLVTITDEGEGSEVPVDISAIAPVDLINVFHKYV